MQITNRVSITPNYNTAKNPHKTTNVMNTQSLNFNGGSMIESYGLFGLKTLIHHTSFGREQGTNEFVCNYIRENFAHRNKIRIVSGGCSTGEEELTLSMMLYNMKDKVELLGIDLGKKAIKQAKSRKYIFEIPKKNVNILDYFEKEEDAPYFDGYLINGQTKGLTASQRHLLSLFNEFFEPKGKKLEPTLIEKLQYLLQKNNGYEPIEVDRIEYKLKDGMAENCRFVQGDIRNIDKILNGEKQEAIYFRNSLYHLITDNLYSDTRTPVKDSPKIVEDLMTKFRSCLNKDGLVVFGEKEGPQIGDSELVPRIMTKLNFAPLNETAEHGPNVWKVID